MVGVLRGSSCTAGPFCDDVLLAVISGTCGWSHEICLIGDLAELSSGGFHGTRLAPSSQVLAVHWLPVLVASNPVTGPYAPH